MPILVECKHRESIKWIPLTDDSVYFLDTKNQSSGAKETTFGTVQAADLQSRLRIYPTPMTMCKTESLPGQ